MTISNTLAALLIPMVTTFLYGSDDNSKVNKDRKECRKERDEHKAVRDILKAEQEALKGPSCHKKRTLTIFTTPGKSLQKQAIDSLISAFNQKYEKECIQAQHSENPTWKKPEDVLESERVPDVFVWSAGNSMRSRVAQLTDVIDIWTQDKLADSMPSLLSTMTVSDKQYGVPFAVDPWVIYYNDDVFTENELKVPDNWEELMSVCQKLKKEGITPFAIGTELDWPVSLWFDYLNLRINGRNFRDELVRGSKQFEDPNVVQVMKAWKTLIGKGYFLPKHDQYNELSVLGEFKAGKAAMYLFRHSLLPADQRKQYKVFRFPSKGDADEKTDVAYIDTLHIPHNASNKDDAKKFLRFAASQEGQEAMKREDLAYLSPRKDMGGQGPRSKIVANATHLVPPFGENIDPKKVKVDDAAFKAFMLNPPKDDKIAEFFKKLKSK